MPATGRYRYSFVAGMARSYMSAIEPLHRHR